MLWAVGMIGFLIIFIGWLTISRTLAVPVTPFSADAFVDSVGIVTHLGYTDTPYAQNWGKGDSSQDTRALLTELGIRHVRDGIPHPTLDASSAYTRPRAAQLYRDYGIRMITLPDSRTNGILDPTKIDPYLEEYANGTIDLEGENIPVRNVIEAIEGPNEYDNHNSQDKRDPDWVANLRNYQSELYRKVKGNSKLAQLPVIMPSLIYTKYCTDVLGSLQEMSDLGNLHPYPNYPYFQIPTGSLGWHLGHGKDCFGNKPVYVTEVGYQSGGGGISDQTIAKYTSMLLPEYFLQPQIKRTYIYSLMDTLPDRDLWGLIHPERNGQTVNGYAQFTLTRKPSYYAVKGLLDLLGEGTWSKSQRKWVSPAVTLKPVEIALNGTQDSTHHLLLQKSTGDYYLLLWQQVEAFNPTAGNFEPPADDVNISLPSGYKFQALYQYDANFQLKGTALEGRNQVSVNVPDSVMVLQFKA